MWPHLVKAAAALPPSTEKRSHARRLYERLRPKVFADLERLHQLEIVDFSEKVVGKAAEADVLTSAADRSALAEVAWSIRSLCLRAIMNCENRVERDQASRDVDTLLSLIGDCETYEIEFDRLLEELRRTQGLE